MPKALRDGSIISYALKINLDCINQYVRSVANDSKHEKTSRLEIG